MKKKITYAGLAFILLGSLVLSNLTDENANTKEIANLLSKELNYSDIETMSMNGFLLTEGIYGDSHLITINGSSLASINKSEAVKILKIFDQKLSYFNEADYIELSFSNIKSKDNKIIFKRGKITNL